MLIEKKLLSQLKPAVYNPRIDLKPTDKEYQAIKNSIESFGNIEPIIWNKRTGNIVGGHQRYKILKEKGILETEVVVVDFDEEKEKAANLALNKAVGLWDEEAVDKLLIELKDTQWNMEDYNFDLSNIDLLNELDNDITHNTTTDEEKHVNYDTVNSLDEAIDRSKTSELLNELNKFSLPHNLREFFQLAAYRFTVFDYRKIFNYYHTKATEQERELLRKLDLVFENYYSALQSNYAGIGVTEKGMEGINVNEG